MIKMTMQHIQFNKYIDDTSICGGYIISLCLFYRGVVIVNSWRPCELWNENKKGAYFPA